jgi:TBC1 domain family member 8/9
VTPAMRRSASKSSLSDFDHTTPSQSPSSPHSAPSLSSTYSVADSRSPITPHTEFPHLGIVEAANAALIMERTPFAIDDAKDDDDEDDYNTDEETEVGGDDDLVLDEAGSPFHLCRLSAHFFFIG